MTGDYTAKDPQSKSLTLLSDWHRGKPEQTVSAEYWEFVDRSTPSEGPGVPVQVEWLDPAIWAPVKPGEHRQLWMRWTVPVNTDRLQVTIEDTTYMMFPQDPGTWGNITTRHTERTRVSTTVEHLLPFCGYAELCERLGVDIDSVWLLFDGKPTTSGWDFPLLVEPLPDVSDLSIADLSVWYQGQTKLYHPSRNPWIITSDNKAQIRVNVDMPISELPLYVRADFGDGEQLTWGTVANMRNTIFSNPQWAWKTDQEGWGEEAALQTADMVCWAHWTNKLDPGTSSGHVAVEQRRRAKIRRDRRNDRMVDKESVRCDLKNLWCGQTGQ